MRDRNAALFDDRSQWDRVKGDFVERKVAGDTTPCLALGWTWVVRPVEDEPVGLRLLDADGELVLTHAEAEARGRAEAEARAQAERARAEAEAARAAALEAELRVLRAERTR